MNENMHPISRREKFLAKIAGEDVGDIQPITRREYWLDKIAKKPGGGAMRINVSSDVEGNYFADKTNSEIGDAILAGVIPFCVYTGDFYSFYGSSLLNDISTLAIVPRTTIAEFSKIVLIGPTTAALDIIIFYEDGAIEHVRMPLDGSTT